MSYKYEQLNLSIGETTLNIPFFFRKFSSKVTLDQINKTFAEQIKCKKITVTTKETKLKDLICISGIVNWDGIPVTDFVLSYQKPPFNYSISDITATVFTFYGRSKINLYEILKESSCDNKYLMQKMDIYKNQLGARREVLYTHYTNAIKSFICENNKFSVKLANMTSFLNDCETNIPNATGLPIYIRKGYSVLSYDVSLTNFETEFLDRASDEIFKLDRLAFLHPIFDCAVISGTFYTNTLASFQKHKLAWKKIVLELDGNEALLTLANRARGRYPKLKAITDTSFTIGDQKIEFCCGPEHNTIVITPVT